MNRFPARARRWSRSAEDTVAEATAGEARVLTDADTDALVRLCAEDPVANCFVDSILLSGRRAGPARGGGSLFLGIDDDGAATAAPDATGTDGRLRAACWVGANVVPVGAGRHDGERFGAATVALRRRFASVYGPDAAVLGIWDQLAEGPQRPRDIRPDQPLMELRGDLAVDPAPGVHPAVADDFATLLPASVAMFEEELGVSPLKNGSVQYRLRVEELIRNRRALMETDEQGSVRFKADLGVVSEACSQIQGVWIRPELRGQGLAAPAMAAVAEYARAITPRVSLYVNGYNVAAVRTYRRVGFEQVGTFATVLL